MNRLYDKNGNQIVYEFRPDKLLVEHGSLMRYNDGNWIDDDGEYDIAFFDKLAPFFYGVNLSYRENLLWSWCKDMKWAAFVRNHPGGNAWHYMSCDGSEDMSKRFSRRERESHLNELSYNEARNRCSGKHGCANGRGVEFNVMDKTILSGLLRYRDTKEIITIPEIFKCIYCGEHDLRIEQPVVHNESSI